MENLLQGIHQVILPMDDILISGKDNNNHIANLEAVLNKLPEAGLRLRKEKHFFMVSEVTYYDYEINGHGIKPVEDKVEAKQNASVPENVTQLCARPSSKWLLTNPRNYSSLQISWYITRQIWNLGE